VRPHARCCMRLVSQTDGNAELTFALRKHRILINRESLRVFCRVGIGVSNDDDRPPLCGCGADPRRLEAVFREREEHLR
jgi:hypothetical protein